MKKKILIIIDAQHDFCDKNGALYVPNAEIAIDNIISFINENKGMIEQVVFTEDNHPSDHCSFKKNGGIWPEHCVQHTYGQALMLPLLECCDDNDLPVNVIKKGERKDKDEYTAFCNNGNVTLRYYATLFLDKLPEFGDTSGEENEVTDIKWIPLKDFRKYKWAFNHYDIVKNLYKESLTIPKFHSEEK